RAEPGSGRDGAGDARPGAHASLPSRCPAGAGGPATPSAARPPGTPGAPRRSGAGTRSPSPRGTRARTRARRARPPPGGRPRRGSLLVRAQLRDVLAAEDSAVVPQEDEDRRPGLPERPEPDLAPVDVRQADVRERGRDRR